MEVHGRCSGKKFVPMIVFLLSELLSMWMGPLRLLAIYLGVTMSFSFILGSFILKIIIFREHILIAKQKINISLSITKG